MLAGVVIGLAIIALSALLRAGLPAWLGLIVGMVVFSNQPEEAALALGAGVGTYLVARVVITRRTWPR